MNNTLQMPRQSRQFCTCIVVSLTVAHVFVSLLFSYDVGLPDLAGKHFRAAKCLVQHVAT